MENLEQQLQQLRLIHNRISSNDTNASVGGAGAGAGAGTGGQLPTTITPTYKPSPYGYAKKHGVSAANSVGVGGAADDIGGGPNRVAAVRWDGMGLNKRHDTLDNPIVLDQQLEALAHHKRQMEKRGLLQNQQIQYNIHNKGVSHQQQQQQQQDIEPNKNIFKGMQAPPKASLFGLNENANLQIQVDDDDDDDDNETSPPSPVSSSYSELRHAAESSSSSSKLKQTQLQQQQQQHHHHMLSGNGGTYMNLAYGPNACSPVTAAAAVGVHGGGGAAVAIGSAGASSLIINNQQDCTDYYDFGNFSQV